MNYKSMNMNTQKKLARAYVHAQPYIGMISLDEALKRGSVFPNLYQPYKKKKLKK
ncbi:Spore coat associated protein JA (CotJA) [Alkalithermobacter thermoalcaliphilus JW-YL-7 = DSM 7308]|uniref:Spore coat associated protein JA (CotJA) n=1 Tax=Alkalithermobacter thermoalcaliphilus JW-YL-7 = DSM 7308 TaxID=1121328 RepID=A0A150FSR8_CLOPD|nr:Spore coat protein CotJA [[Clostridium] paradoxum JW-YL-7 = DSM 7308]SHL18474.1 Spore coat associated protein JA (CotJA) [[Clostridium] paradoxum JW-YL-7 = DSM 7308]